MIAKLLEHFLNLFEWILRLKKESPEGKLPSGYPIYRMKWGVLKTMLAQHGIVCMLKDEYPPDHEIHYTDEVSWEAIVPYLVISADKYVKEGADCDDYAKGAAARAALDFHRNGCLECWGQVSNSQAEGSHAWGLVITGGKTFKLFEPNAGFEYTGILFGQGENGCTAESWK